MSFLILVGYQDCMCGGEILFYQVRNHDLFLASFRCNKKEILSGHG